MHHGSIHRHHEVVEVYEDIAYYSLGCFMFIWRQSYYMQRTFDFIYIYMYIIFHFKAQSMRF